MSICREFKVLPRSGGVMDQRPSDIRRLRAVMEAADEVEATENKKQRSRTNVHNRFRED